MKLKFNEWLHDGMFENRSYTFFIKENVVSDPRLVISDPRLKMMDDPSSPIMFNIEFDHRILQFAKKIASMPTKANAKEKITHIDDFLKVKNPELKKAIKNKVPTEVMGGLPSHVSMFPINNIKDDHFFKFECEKYIEKFPTIDEIYDKNRDINFYEKLTQAANVVSNFTRQQVRAEDLIQIMISGEKKPTKNPKHAYMNIKFPKVDGTEIFNKFNSGGYDQIIANTIIERNKESFSPKMVESKWLFAFVGQMKNIAKKEIDPDIKLKQHQRSIAQFQGRDISAKKDTKDLEDSEKFQIAEPLKRQDVGVEKLSKKVEEIISNIKSYEDIPYNSLLNPSSPDEQFKIQAKLFATVFNNVTKKLDENKGKLSKFVIAEMKKIFDEANIKLNDERISRMNKLYSSILDKAASELNDESITKFINVVRSQNKKARDRGKIIV